MQFGDANSTKSEHQVKGLSGRFGILGTQIMDYTIHGQNKDSRQAGSAYDGGWALGRDEDEKGDKGRMQVLNCEDI